MGGSTKTTQDTTQHQQQAPYDPTVPGLNLGAGQLTSQFGNTGINPTEQGAFNTLSANAAAGNPYAPAIGNLATDLLKGGPDYTGRVNSAFDQFSGSLAPTISGQYLDPSTNPFYQQTSDAATARVRDLTNQMFAGSGGFGGSANQGTLATNVTNALAPIFQNQYNTERQNQLNAINQQFGGANTATGLLSNLSQTSLGNRGAGVGAAQAALGANDSAASQQLAIQAAQRGLPISNIQQILGPLSGVAQLGGTTDMQGHTTQQQSVPLLQQLIGGAIGGAGLLGGANKALGAGWASGLGGAGAGAAGSAAGAAGTLGAFGEVASALGPLAFLASDERVKEDIAPVGKLADGQPVYTYRYIGDPTPRIGLMAQDVERVHPEAVMEIGGIKHVNYDRATSTARGILGHL